MFIKDYTEEDRFLNLFDSLFIYAYLHWKMIPFLSRLKVDRDISDRFLGHSLAHCNQVFKLYGAAFHANMKSYQI